MEFVNTDTPSGLGTTHSAIYNHVTRFGVGDFLRKVS